MRILRLAQEGVLADNVAATFATMLVGFAIGAAAGVGCGVVLGLMTRVAMVVNPFVIALYNVPMLAIVPLLILWFGIYAVAKITIVAIVVFFLMFFNTFAGVTEVDRDLVMNTNLLGANRRWIIQRVVLPSSYPWIVAGVKVALPYALVAAVVAEMMMTTGGMGAFIVKSSSMMDATGTFAVLFVLMIVAVALDQISDMAGRYLLRWRQPHQ